MKETISKRKSLISVRGGFSDTNGLSTCNKQMQFEEFDDTTRCFISNKIFDLLELFFENYQIENRYKGNGVPAHLFCKSILCNVLKKRTKLLKGQTFNWRSIYEIIDEIISEAPYNEVLDIVQYICNWLTDNYYFNFDERYVHYDTMNNIFEKEYVGYRFVDGRIVAITDSAEISEIEIACRISIDGCKAHIKKAVGFLSDREIKDYKNCIKESISAVETMCQIIMEDESATLGAALKKLKDNGFQIHPALEAAFLKLYGYTSNKGGIRHCEGLFVSDISFEEAKFMLVSCSAFVNYLIVEYGKHK